VLTGLQDVDMAWMEQVRRNAGCSNLYVMDDEEEAAGADAAEQRVLVGEDGSVATAEAVVAAAGNATTVVRRCPRIVPRVSWELQTLEDGVFQEAVRQVQEAAQRYGFDGVVLEATVHPGFMRLVRRMAKAMHSIKSVWQPTPTGGKATCEFILVLPPHPVPDEDKGANQPGKVTPSMVARYANMPDGEHVDRFSVMTYDFSATKGEPGPNSPMRWARDVIQSLAPNAAAVSAVSKQPLRSLLLFGVPFYGYDNTDAIVGRRFVELVAAQAEAQSEGGFRLRVDASAEENYFTYTGDVVAKGKKHKNQKHSVFYPTPWFVKKRMQAAASLGAGVSIWEIGQGLDCFYEYL
jgi:chitinase domain-containing protein 1